LADGTGKTEKRKSAEKCVNVSRPPQSNYRHDNRKHNSSRRYVSREKGEGRGVREGEREREGEEGREEGRDKGMEEG